MPHGPAPLPRATAFRIPRTRATRCARTTCSSISRERYRVFLGTFVDDPADWQHVDAVRALCADAWFGRIHAAAAQLWSLAGLLTGEALTLAYYRDAGAAALGRRGDRASTGSARRVRVLVPDGAVRARRGRAPPCRRLRRRRFGQVDAVRRRAPLAAVWRLSRAKARALLAFERQRRARGATRASSSPAEGGRAVPRARARRAGTASRHRANGVDARLLLAGTRAAAIAVSRPARSRSSSPARWTTGRTSTRCAGSRASCCRDPRRSGRRCASTSSA